MHLHLIAILLFPIRVVTSPLMVLPTWFFWALANNTSPNAPHCYFIPSLIQVMGAWIVWHG